jgi:hypothetical protein
VVKKPSPKKRKSEEERIESEDYTEFMKEELRIEDLMRFDMAKMENL